MDKYYIPKKLDVPFKIMFFTLDEIGLTLIPFILIAFVFDKPLLAMAVCMITFFGIKKIKGDEDAHFIKHFLYWHFPPVIPYKSTPASFIREIIG